jgi:hypothetical protein
MTIAVPGMKVASKQVGLLRKVLRSIWRKVCGVLSCVTGMVAVLEPARAADPRFWRIHFHVIVYVQGRVGAAWNAEVRRWNRRRERMPPSLRMRVKKRSALSANVMKNEALRVLRGVMKRAGISKKVLAQEGLVHVKPFDVHKADEWDSKFCTSDAESLGWHAGSIVSYATCRSKASAVRMSERDWVNLQVARIGRAVSCFGALRLSTPSRGQVARRRAADMAEQELRVRARKVLKKPVSTMRKRQAIQAMHKRPRSMHAQRCQPVGSRSKRRSPKAVSP